MCLSWCFCSCYYGYQFGYGSYGWIGAVIGAIIGALVGGIAFAFFFSGTDIGETEESWGETLLGIMIFLLSLLLFGGVIGGVCYIFNRFPILWIIVALVLLGIVGLFYYWELSDRKTGELGGSEG